MTRPEVSLYHFTCKHGHLAIGDEGDLLPPYVFAREIPHVDSLPMFRFVWLTDLTLPIREPLGLTQNLARCDRTEFRYRALDTSEVYPWVIVRRGIPKPWRESLEEAYGARPSHWYVSTHAVPAILDPVP